MVYRSVIIGCGKIGSENAEDPRIKGISTHAGAYVNCSQTELVAVCDSDLEKSERCGEMWGAPYHYQNYEKMLLEIQPDIVSVCTPDNTHFTIILNILKTPNIKAIFAEKPLTLNIKDARDIVNLAEKNKIILAVNYSRRYSKKIFDLKKSLQAGEFGEIQTVNGYYTKGTIHNGTHWFDLALFLIGDIKKVQGFDVIKENSPDPTFDVLLEFENRVNGYLHACDTTKFSIFEMDIIGTKGRIILKDFGHILEIYNVADSPYNTGFKSLIVRNIHSDVMNNLLLIAIEDIVQCIREGKTPLCSGKDGILSLKIASAVCISVTSGKAIELGSSHEE